MMQQTYYHSDSQAYRRVISVLRQVEDVLDHSIYAVGGPVRDLLLGKTPNDVDVASSLTPQEVIECAEKSGIRVIPTGIEYGTVTLVINGENIEHTTFRKEQYRDDRHPEVAYTTSIEEDLSRRDFTINAMALSSQGEIIDPFHGREDIQKGIIRAVGDPNERFFEDPLRIIRAARFAARYGFHISMETFFAAHDYVHELTRRVATERVTMEIEKALKQVKQPSEYFKLLDALGVEKKIFHGSISLMHTIPQQAKWHHLDVYAHTMKVIDLTKKYSDETVTSLQEVSYEDEVRRAYKKYQEDMKKIEAIKRTLARNGQQPYSVHPRDFYDYVIEEIGNDDINEYVLVHDVLTVTKGVEVSPEDIEDRETDLLLSALFHDVGKAVMFRSQTVDKIVKVEKDSTWNWHFSCHELVSADVAEEELKRMRFPNKTVDYVKGLVAGHDFDPNVMKHVHVAIMRATGMGAHPERTVDLLLLKKGDLFGHREWVKSEWPDFIRAFVNASVKPYTRKELAIDYNTIYSYASRKYPSAQARVIAGKLMKKLVMETWYKIDNTPTDLRYRVRQLIDSGWTGDKKNPYYPKKRP